MLAAYMKQFEDCSDDFKVAREKIRRDLASLVPDELDHEESISFIVMQGKTERVRELKSKVKLLKFINVEKIKYSVIKLNIY